MSDLHHINKTLRFEKLSPSLRFNVFRIAHEYKFTVNELELNGQHFGELLMISR